MKTIGTFTSEQWGRVNVCIAHYGFEVWPLAVLLELDNGERLCVLSVNMYRPDCSADSKDLPPGCFYVKHWGQEDIVADALASGLFIERPDLPRAASGHVIAAAWQVRGWE